MIKTKINTESLTCKAMNLLEECRISWTYLLKDGLILRNDYKAVCFKMLSIIWIVEHCAEAPGSFEELREVISYKMELNSALDSLWKESSQLISHNDTIDTFIQENLEYLTMAVEYLE